MSTVQTETAAIKASAASGGTATFTMEEGHWEISKVDGYLVGAMGAAPGNDITVSVNGVAVTLGDMRMAAGAALPAGGADGATFQAEQVLTAGLKLYQGDVITVANVTAANVAFIHLRRS